MNLADIKHLPGYTEWANEQAMAAASDLPADYFRREISRK